MNNIDSSRSALKRFLQRTALGSIPVMVFLGALAYFALEIRPKMSGDLGVLGKIPFSQEYSEGMYKPVFPDTLVRWFPADPNMPRVATIGDSFSMQVQNGYQNFLAHQLGESVAYLTTDRLKVIPEQGAIDLLNSGFFDRYPNLEWIVVETVERELVDRWLRVDFDKSPEDDLFMVCHPGEPLMGDVPDKRNYFGNLFREGLDWLKIKAGFDENPVREVGLSKDCFTMPGKTARLYFYQDDLNCISTSDEELLTVKNNIQRLHDMFAGKGIKMLFFMACDKYEVYQHLAVENPYPERPLGRQLSAALDSLDYFVNPLPELKRKVDAGELDIFMADDSHWSSKGASTAASLLSEKITESY